MTIYYAVLACIHLWRSNKPKYLENIYSVIIFVLICHSFVSVYKERGMVKSNTLGVLDRIKFLATIMQLVPGNDLGKWDNIARHMNYHSHVKGV
ncbi:hypothetical protein ZYGR_0P00100 [Zygosaccharomyces rouxii]|uniref:Uncharacterized protein n=1 Tax=Zygosaccharomyces rouxii TaxID=4956 RepID=A0A1Q3A0Z0_ZYGRO|nr:hypothetical protein ZYGR_0P00100 [Zygosaccharomyces rouxii]